MEARRPRLLIKGWLRGYFPTNKFLYGVRSITRRELILHALANEEDAQLAKNAYDFNISMYADKYQPGEAYNDFVDRLIQVFNYALDKWQLKDADILTKEEAFLNSQATKNLINDFKYMKEHGILQDMRDKVMAHRRSLGIQ